MQIRKTSCEKGYSAFLSSVLPRFYFSSSSSSRVPNHRGPDRLASSKPRYSGSPLNLSERSRVFFFIRKQKSMARVPYNKLLTNLASSSCTGRYWPSVVFVRFSLRLVRIATPSSQYSPVRPSRSFSKRRLVFYSTTSYL